MNLLDYILLSSIVLITLHGVLRGLRSSLWIFVIFLSSFLAQLIFIPPLERLMLNLAGIGYENFPGAPAVAVFILEDNPFFAFLTSLLPGFITMLLLIVYTAASFVSSRASHRPFSVSQRILGAFVGFFAGLSLNVLIFLQLARIPWITAAKLAQNSLLFSAFNYYDVFHVITDLSGGF